MHKKRFRVVKDGEKPLQTKATNVKTTLPDSAAKSPSTKKSTLDSRKRKAIPAVGPDKRKKRSPSTLFDSEAVQIKVVDPSNDALKKINGAHCAESEPSERSPHGRLTPVKEEEESLKIEDFDQPPQSTSTPVLQSADMSLEEENGSPFLVNQPGNVSPVLYQPNPYAYPGSSQMGSHRGSPFLGRPFMEQNGYPVQFMAGYYGYVPSQPPPMARLPEDPHVYGYSPYAGPIGEPDPRYRALHPMEGMRYQPEALISHTRPMLYRDAAFPTSSDTASYKSSGGEATYPDSNQSSKRVGGSNI